MKMGRNLKWTIGSADDRAAIRRMFVEVFGAQVVNPRPDIEVYVLSDGGNVGVVAADGLDPKCAQQGAWLEFLADDVDKIVAALEVAGAKRLEYFDKDHAYFQIGASPVFRIARA